MSSIRPVLIPILAVFALTFNTCKVNYSFTGANISPDVKTLSIATFQSVKAPLAPPILSQSFTESLKDKFLRQTNLTLVKNSGDLIIEGEITNYKQTDVAITGNATSQASLAKLTITVNVVFTDTKNDQNSYEQSFSQFEQFDASKSLSEVESELIDAINEKLTQDIFNRTLGNW